VRRSSGSTPRGAWSIGSTNAKKAETRERRLAKFIDMLEAGETLY
jgi:uncharacterized protein YdeI (YjbR/CyaY-like superfamily)